MTDISGPGWDAILIDGDNAAPCAAIEATEAGARSLIHMCARDLSRRQLAP